MSNPSPTRIALLLFPGFQLLDATGPMDALALLSLQHPLTLSILAASLDPVPTQNWQQTEAGSAFSSSIVPTHTFDSVKDNGTEFHMMLLPGGLGSRYVLHSHFSPPLHFPSRLCCWSIKTGKAANQISCLGAQAEKLIQGL
jgi:putative intracellular protease/amidase